MAELKTGWVSYDGRYYEAEAADREKVIFDFFDMLASKNTEVRKFVLNNLDYITRITRSTDEVYHVFQELKNMQGVECLESKLNG